MMTRKIKIRDKYIGGGAPITVQSMTNTITENYLSTINQINALTESGCDIVRVAVNTVSAAEAVKKIVDAVSIPVVADIHFDYKLAILAMKNGIHKIRINPSNIGSSLKVGEVVAAAKDYGLPIRIGVNGGSLDKEIKAKYGNSAEALAESALKQVAELERFGFNDIVISLKSSDTIKTVAANRIVSSRCDYPLHLGVTEAGGGALALAKSYIGIGSLLLDNIGDTIRVSLSASPLEEIKAALDILYALKLRKDFVEVVSCPTCGRTEYDVIGVSAKLREIVKDIKKPLKIAVMGCIVNGIGESEDADLGIAGGKEKSIIFEKGKKLFTVDNDKVLDTIIGLLEKKYE